MVLPPFSVRSGKTIMTAVKLPGRMPEVTIHVRNTRRTKFNDAMSFPVVRLSHVVWP